MGRERGGPSARRVNDSAAVLTRPSWWSQLLVIAWLYVIYDQINNLASVSAERAKAHAIDILDVQKALHIDIELSTNQWLDGQRWLGHILGNFYNAAHLWVTGIVLAWVWWKRVAIYRPLRNALALTNVIGLIVFWAWPVAPPRWLPELGYVDVVREVGAIGSWHEGALAERANEFAAMPSLHVAWAWWCLVALRRGLSGRVGTSLGVAHVALTVIAIVLTGNHWVLDAVAGLVAGVVPVAAADWWAARRQAGPTVAPEPTV
jgi:hypothetical protein